MGDRGPNDCGERFTGDLSSSSELVDALEGRLEPLTGFVLIQDAVSRTVDSAPFATHLVFSPTWEDVASFCHTPISK